MLNLSINLLFILFFKYQTAYEISDSKGYITYCPCMGRFGNQADHFLGALAFSKALSRTLILPPWVEYRYGEPNSTQVPFNKYFDVSTLAKYHNVVTMEDFMINTAPSVWPPDKRVSFCYMKRHGEKENSCNAKSGNPFGPFWDAYSIDFMQSEFYGPLNYDTENKVMMEKWKEKYPASKWPVLAFTGAPASFPVQQNHKHLQKYLSWNKDISDRSLSFIKQNLSGGFLGVHFRNGQDWVKACEHVQNSPTLFAAPQCIGYKNENGPLTKSMCLPNKSDIIRQIKKVLKSTGIKKLFVASDSNHMIKELNSALHKLNIRVVKLHNSDPHLDLAILGRANHFIGNCVSSFTAFVKRQRDVLGLPSYFWSFPQNKSKHDEL